MARAGELFAVVNDPRLTPDAVRVVLHYASKGEGPHDYDRDELAQLLEEAGPRRIGAALTRAERIGYLVRKIGGRGHSDTFTVELSPAQCADLKDSSAQSADLSVDRTAQRADLNAPHTRETRSSLTTDTSTTHHFTSPREGAHARLCAYLGEHADAADRFVLAVKPDQLWASGFMGTYGPEGTDALVWGGLPPPERPAVLAVALDRYATEGKAYNGRYFRKFLEAARDERRKSVDGSGRGGAERAQAPRAGGNQGDRGRAATGTDGPVRSRYLKRPAGQGSGGAV